MKRTGSHEGGFVVLVLLVMLVPTMLLVGAFTTSMVGSTNEIRAGFEREKALLAAESGVDEAFFRGKTGTLTNGVSFTRSLGLGHSFAVMPTHLLVDGSDNDGDSFTDEADEDVFQVVVTGTYGSAQRTLASYLGPVPLLPPTEFAFGVTGSGVALQVGPGSLISGVNVNMDGAATSPHVVGMVTAPPGTVAGLLFELNWAERLRVIGAIEVPSLGLMTPVDVSDLVTQMSNIASNVLTSSSYTNLLFGDGPSGNSMITYRNGDVTLQGNSRGAGILAVSGDLRVGDNFRFDGVILVLGDFVHTGGASEIYGAVLQGPMGSAVNLYSSIVIRYSAQAVALANSASGEYVSFNGWQELGN